MLSLNVRSDIFISWNTSLIAVDRFSIIALVLTGIILLSSSSDFVQDIMYERRLSPSSFSTSTVKYHTNNSKAGPQNE